jgi:hypothetical protein
MIRVATIFDFDQGDQNLDADRGFARRTSGQGPPAASRARFPLPLVAF